MQRPRIAPLYPSTRLSPKAGARTLARVFGGVVAELIVEFDDINNEWHPDVLADCVDVTDVAPPVEVGWIDQGDGTFAAPPPHVPPPADQSFAALTAGLAITSTATPSVNGTYAGTGARWDAHVHVVTYINAWAAFPGGAPTYDWLDNSGLITFTSTDEFLAVARAIGDWRDAWWSFSEGLTSTPPAGAVTIP